jgi:hypothetical protein
MVLICRTLAATVPLTVVPEAVLRYAAEPRPLNGCFPSMRSTQFSNPDLLSPLFSLFASQRIQGQLRLAGG